jgi:hypothetical protein
MTGICTYIPENHTARHMYVYGEEILVEQSGRGHLLEHHHPGGEGGDEGVGAGGDGAAVGVAARRRRRGERRNTCVRLMSFC